jgi:hypothetical protein
MCKSSNTQIFTPPIKILPKIYEIKECISKVFEAMDKDHTLKGIKAALQFGVLYT